MLASQEAQEVLKKYLGVELFSELDQTIQGYLDSYLDSGICVDGESAYEQVCSPLHILLHLYFVY